MEFNYGSYGYIAKKDLDAAVSFITINCNASVQYSQQALEKLLKEYITQRYFNSDVKELLKSHKLKLLYTKAGLLELSKYECELQTLSDYYFDGRYPGINYKEPTKEEALKLLKAVENSFEIIYNKLRNPSEEMDETSHFSNL